jgi:4-hydroxymandelate oxidase
MWQQIYVLRDRGISDEVARRAADAGARALVVTVDTPVVASKPASLPDGAMRTGLIPELDERDASDERLWQAADLLPADLERLADVSGLPVVAKGVLRGDQARRCVEAGARAVIVSTHGGRQLDSVVSVPRALPEVAAAVGADAEVYADGGIRHGIDVVAALALGARAVFLGRPILWALATGGADQVASTLRQFQDELVEALALVGCASVTSVGADVVDMGRPAGW